MSKKELVVEAAEVLRASLQSLNGNPVAELNSLAFNNLKKMLEDEDSAFAHDPELALEATHTIATLRQSELETRRRCVDTLIKARSLFESQSNPPPNILPDAEQPKVPDQTSSGNSFFA